MTLSVDNPLLGLFEMFSPKDVRYDLPISDHVSYIAMCAYQPLYSRHELKLKARAQLEQVLALTCATVAAREGKNHDEHDEQLQQIIKV